jgi:hypothetical protein
MRMNLLLKNLSMVKSRTLRNRRTHVNKQIRIKIMKKPCMDKLRNFRKKTADWRQ